MNSYLVTVTGQNSQTFKRLKMEATLKYDEHRRLVEFKIAGDLTEKSHNYFLQILPRVEDQVNDLKARPNIAISVIPPDLTFAAFWEAYDNKISKKSRTELVWQSLDEVDRAKAIKHIKIYNNYLLMNPGIAKKHADTYLRSQMWNN